MPAGNCNKGSATAWCGRAGIKLSGEGSYQGRVLAAPPKSYTAELIAVWRSRWIVSIRMGH